MWMLKIWKGQTAAIFCFLIVIGGLFLPLRVQALGTEIIGRPAPLTNQEDWAPGLRDALDNNNRVYSVWVNGNETFFYRGTIPELNEALVKFAKVKQEGLRIVVQQSPGRTRMSDGTEVPYDWAINVPSGLYLQAARLGQIQNPVLTPTLTICLSGREEPGLPQIRWPKGIPVLDAEALQQADKDKTAAGKDNKSNKTPASPPEFVGTQPSADSEEAKTVAPGETPAFVGAAEPVTSSADNETPNDPQAIGFVGEQTPVGTPPAETPAQPRRSIAALFETETQRPAIPAAPRISSSETRATSETPNTAFSSTDPAYRPDASLTPAEEGFLIQRVNSVLEKMRQLDTERTRKAARRSKPEYGVSPVPYPYASSNVGKAAVRKPGQPSKVSPATLPPARFPQKVSSASPLSDSVTQQTVRAMGARTRSQSSSSETLPAPSGLQATATPDTENLAPPPSSSEPRTDSMRLTVHPVFSVAQAEPLFRVDYTHAGPGDLSVAQTLAEERLILDGREYAPLQIPTSPVGPDRLLPGQSWRHTIALSNFLPTTPQPDRGRVSARASRGPIALEPGEHTLILKFAGQTSVPVRFEWTGGPLLTE